MNNENTTMFDLHKDMTGEIKDALSLTFEALKEKGYDPISQIVGYIMSGDPIYITSHNGARSAISKIDREEILEVVFEEYLKNAAKEK